MSCWYGHWKSISSNVCRKIEISMKFDFTVYVAKPQALTMPANIIYVRVFGQLEAMTSAQRFILFPPISSASIRVRGLHTHIDR